MRELYGYVALLTGRDRAKTERLVTDVYRSLFRAATAGQLDAVRLSSLRSAGRRLWLERNDAELARPARLSPAPVKSIAELSVIERAVVVLRHVNGMSDARTGDELGRPAGEIAAISDHAVRRLRGTTDTSGAWLRAYFDASVAPRAGLVDRIVGELGPRDDTPAVSSLDQPTQPLEAIEPVAPVDDPAVEPVTPVEDAAGEPVLEDEATAPLPVTETAESAPAESAPAESAPDGASAEVPTPADESPAGSDATDAITRNWRELSIAELGAGAAPTPVDPAADPAEASTTELPATGRPADDPTDDPTADPAGLATTELPATGRSAATSGAPVSDLPVAAPPVPAAPRRWWPVALVAVLAAALVAIWWFTLRDDAVSTDSTLPGAVADDPTATTVAGATATSVAAAVASTVPPSTVAVPTTAPAAETTVPVVIEPSTVLLEDETLDVVDPPCSAWYVQPTPASPALPTAFGPLGPNPAVSLALPTVVDGVAATIVEPAGDGLLVGVLQSDLDGTAAATVLARVGTDGQVHWVRCYDETLIVTGEPNADLDAAVGRFVDGQLGWYLISMADGDISTAVDPVTRLALDVIYQRGPADPVGPTARWESGVLTGFDGDGNVTWTAPDVSTLSGEGFVLAVGDDLAIAHTCDDAECAAGRLRAYDLGSGDLIWEREGFRNVAAVADGVALIGSPDAGWELVDSASGAVVPGQTWDDPELFLTQCCGEGEVWFTERVGGLVVAARPGVVDLWLPAESTGDTVVADLAPPS